MDRRTYVATVAGLGLAGVAGCIDDPPTDGSDDDADSNDDSNDDTADADHGAVEAVASYVEASQAGDEETLRGLAHPDSPMHPAWGEEFANESGDEWEYQEGDPPSYEDVSVELLQEDVDLADVDDVQYLEFWLEDDALDLIDGNGTALVRTTWTNTNPDGYGYPDELDEENHWVLSSADGEWQILWMDRPQGTPEDFEEPIEDDGRLVDRIEYDVQEVDGEMTEFYDSDEVHMAEVHFVDDPDPDVDGVRVESTVALGSSGIEPVGGGAMLSAQVDPDGDEVTVYAIVDGDQEVVHRERYEP